jgi:hypothetical protein
MKVRAKTTGIRGGHRVRPGVVFELAAGEKLGAWMEPVVEEGNPSPATPPPAAAAPATFAQINKRDGESKGMGWTERQPPAKAGATKGP